MTLHQDLDDQEMEEQWLGEIWLYFVDQDEWKRLVVTRDGVVLGSIAQWLVWQGVVAIQGWRVEDVLFYW